MSLKKIEMYGFKSFPDKIEMTFDSGVTAIVGPNGCGKSNVSDAIRWVFGEQSPKMLRGKSMQDLIFAGTVARKSMSYCEVSLYFDNSDRQFPLDFDEVVISRKMYRSGESDYMINRAMSRLKDVSDLLREVGLGRDGYSIVGQGRIDAILNAKPEERRAIFEEALGISKFRVRKVESERKLEKTKDNMSRLKDIMYELERQISPLKKQSDDAKRYKDVYDKLRTNEINAFLYSYDNAEAIKKVISDKINVINVNIEEVTQRYTTACNNYENLRSEITNIDDTIEVLQCKQTELSVNIEKQSGEEKLNFERLRFYREEKETLTNEIGNVNSQIDEAAKRIESITRDIAEMNKSHVLLLNELTLLNDKLGDVAQNLIANQGKSDNASVEAMKLYEDISSIKTTSAGLSSERQMVISRTQELQTELQKSTAIALNIKGLVTNLETEMQQLSANKTNLDNTINASTASLSSVDNNLFALNRDLNRYNQQLGNLNTRNRTIKQFIDGNEGFSNSVKSLLNDASNNQHLSDRILGVVANILTVPKDYEVAIDTALGGSMQNVVTKDEEDAKQLINYLKDNKYGRITFLPITSVRPRNIESANVLKESGCIGLASKLVGFDEKFSNIFSSLLGNTVVVDNINTAIYISRKYNYMYRIVTLDGELILPAGSITGGHKKSETSNLFAYERELNESVARVEELNVNIASHEKLIEQANMSRVQLQSVLTDAQAKYQVVLTKWTSNNEQLISAKNNLQQVENNVTQIMCEIDRNNKRHSQIDEIIKNDDVEIIDLIARRDLANVDVGKSQSQYQQLKALSDTLQENITSYKLKIATLTANISTAEKDLNSSTQLLDLLKKTIVDKVARLKRNADNIVETELALRQSNIGQVSFNELTKVEAQRAALNKNKIEVLSNYQQSDNDKTNAQFELQKLNDQKVKEEFGLEKIDMDTSVLRQKIEEDYGLTYSAAMDFKIDDYSYEESKRIIPSLKGQLTSLGVVNLNAIEEYVSVSVRYEDLNSQLTDLQKAEADLTTIITDLTHEMVRKFNDGFDTINSNFSQVFKELFAGGNATLTVVSEDGKDELDYGIEIEAQPPGKRLQNISLLSGGERSLTAVAILFAILKLRPMPFCVLDEIEAALDDANAERVAKYLRKFAKDTQFIVITHKKPTMERADVLYGVTMQEKGVSKVVSVHLTEAIQQTQMPKSAS